MLSQNFGDSVMMKVFVPLLVVVFLLIVALFADFSDRTRLFREIQNSGHAVVFGLMALTILVAIRNLSGKWLRNKLLAYLAAGSVTLVIGAILEMVQLAGPRDADPVDLLIDAAGIIGCLALYFTFDPKMSMNRAGWGQHTKRIIRAAAIVILLTPFVMPSAWALAYLARNREIPNISFVNSAWSKWFLYESNTVIKKSEPPAEWIGARSAQVASIRFEPTEYPGIHLIEPFPDWKDYSYFCFSLYSSVDSTLQLSLRIEDIFHNYEHKDRFNEIITVESGPNRYRINLDRLRRAPAGREMDLTNIAAVMLFASKPTESFTLLWDGFYLE